MTGCHCAKIIYGFWENQMTQPIKNKIAGLSFNAQTYTNIFKLADEVWRSNGGANSAPAVVAAASAVENSTPTSSSSSDTPQVAAVTRGRGGNRGRGNRGGRGGRGSYNGNNSNQNRPQSNQTSSQSGGSKPHQKGPKHSPDVPDNACARHWREGRNATYCSDPLVCGWVHIIAPRKA